MFKLIALFLWGLFCVGQADARPVSYPGGTTLMQNNSDEYSNLHVHYSPSIRYSIGYRAEFARGSDNQFHGLQFNYLAKRWNQPSAQANLYFKTALGQKKEEKNQLELVTDEVLYLGVAVDWENRRFFSSYSNRFQFSQSGIESRSHSARLGLTPYIGDYGELHTWLMLQVDKNPDEEWVTTPLVRFFKSVYLLELGWSSEHTPLVNFIVRF